MKKAKLLTATLALALSGALCVGFAACGGNERDDQGGDETNDKWEEVTAEEWKAAFQADVFKNVKIEQKIVQEGDLLNDSDAKATINMTYVLAGDNEYFKSHVTVEKGSDELKQWVEEEMNSEEYSMKAGDKYMRYFKNDAGKWTKRLNSVGVAGGALYEYLELAEMYDKFEYEGETMMGYTLKGELLTDEASKEEYESLAGRYFKFKDGKLAAIYHDHGTNTYTENDVEKSNTAVETVTFTYGGQTVKFPEADAFFAGTWKTYQLVVEGTVYDLGDTVPQYVLGQTAVELTAETVVIQIKNDGTASSTNPLGTATGTWTETESGLTFTSADFMEGEPVDLSFDGTYLYMDVQGATYIFQRA